MLVGHRVQFDGRWVDALDLPMLKAEKERENIAIGQIRLREVIEKKNARQATLVFLEGELGKYVGPFKAPVILRQDIVALKEIELPFLGRRIGGLTTAMRRVSV